MSMNFHDSVGFFFDGFCWFVGVCCVLYSLFQTARNVKRQVLRGIVEEQRDIRHAAEVWDAHEGVGR